MYDQVPASTDKWKYINKEIIITNYFKQLILQKSKCLKIQEK